MWASWSVRKEIPFDKDGWLLNDFMVAVATLLLGKDKLAREDLEIRSTYGNSLVISRYIYLKKRVLDFWKALLAAAIPVGGLPDDKMKGYLKTYANPKRALLTHLTMHITTFSKMMGNGTSTWMSSLILQAASAQRGAGAGDVDDELTRMVDMLQSDTTTGFKTNIRHLNAIRETAAEEVEKITAGLGQERKKTREVVFELYWNVWETPQCERKLPEWVESEQKMLGVKKQPNILDVILQEKSKKPEVAAPAKTAEKSEEIVVQQPPQQQTQPAPEDEEMHEESKSPKQE